MAFGKRYVKVRTWNGGVQGFREVCPDPEDDYLLGPNKVEDRG